MITSSRRYLNRYILLLTSAGRRRRRRRKHYQRRAPLPEQVVREQVNRHSTITHKPSIFRQRSQPSPPSTTRTAPSSVKNWCLVRLRDIDRIPVSSCSLSLSLSFSPLSLSHSYFAICPLENNITDLPKYSMLQVPIQLSRT